MDFFIIDAIDGNLITLENMETRGKKVINAQQLSYNFKEGDVLSYDSNSFSYDESKTTERKIYMENLTKDLWK